MVRLLAESCDKSNLDGGTTEDDVLQCTYATAQKHLKGKQKVKNKVYLDKS